MGLTKILLVPGIGGNQLNATLTLWGTANVWLSPTRLVAGGWDWLKLDAQGEGSGASLAPTLRPGGCILWYYPPLYDFFRLRGYAVADCFIDWRKRIAQNAVALADRIRDITASGDKAFIVAHSRGGLVTAAALNLLSADERAARIDGGVSVGTPWKGSPETIEFLVGARGSSAKVGMLLALSGGALRYLRDTNVRATLRSWPSLYELLPDPIRGEVPRANAEALYAPETWANAGLDGVSSLHLQRARQRWEAPPSIPADVRWVNIVGYDIPTGTGVNSAAEIDSPDKVPETRAGDGAVPLWSALLDGKENWKRQAEHKALISDATVLEWMAGVAGPAFF